MTVFLLYEDDGPAGICGQSMEITSPWKILIRVADIDAAYQMQHLDSDALCEGLNFYGIVGTKGRKNARIADVFSDDKDDRWFGVRSIVNVE